MGPETECNKELRQGVLIMAKTEYDPADTDRVISAANYLEVSEFDVFMDAYNAWYGNAPSEKQMERIFLHYLLGEQGAFLGKELCQQSRTRGVFSCRYNT